MPSVPSIKGAAIQSLFQDLLELEAQGELATATLEAELEPDDLALLRAKLEIARWYPLTTYERCTRILCDHHGGDREAFLRERGRAAAKRLSESGLYPQLELADRIDTARRTERLVGDVRLMVTAFGSMLSSGKLVAGSEDAGRLRLEVQDAGHLPDALAHVIHGLVNFLAERIDPDQPGYELERPDPDLWVYLR
jgi:hypothetical protein